MNWNFFGGSFIVILCSVFATRAVETIKGPDNVMEVIQEILRHSDSFKLAEKTGCNCVQYKCGCCLDLNIPEVKLKDKTCINITYLPDEYGLQVTFTINKFTLLNVTVSAKNPPPVCLGIPHFEAEASVCIDFYDLDVKNKTLDGCVKIQIRLLHIVVLDQKCGCFHIPLVGKESIEHAQIMVDSFERSRQLGHYDESRIP